MKRLLHIAPLLVVAACQGRSDPSPAPVASVLAPSVAPAAVGARTFGIDPGSKTSIDLPGKDEHIVATTTAAKGTLTLDPAALQNTRGEVQIDLTTLATKTFEDEKKNAEQTKHARTWLEAVVDGKTQDSFRYATLAIRNVDVTGETALGKVGLTQQEGKDVRTVRATVKGDVLIHGHEVSRSVPVTIDFFYAPGAAADAPSSLRIRTEKPLALQLKEHEIMPRDPVGKVLKWTSELTNRVADGAHVDVDLRATPQPSSAPQASSAAAPSASAPAKKP